MPRPLIKGTRGGGGGGLSLVRARPCVAPARYGRALPTLPWLLLPAAPVPIGRGLLAPEFPKRTLWSGLTSSALPNLPNFPGGRTVTEHALRPTDRPSSEPLAASTFTAPTILRGRERHRLHMAGGEAATPAGAASDSPEAHGWPGNSPKVHPRGPMTAVELNAPKNRKRLQRSLAHPRSERRYSQEPKAGRDSSAHDG